jgi:glycerol uptake operon antiterminator
MLELTEGVEVRRKSIESCLRNKVIPVVWDPEANRDLLARASAVFLQGGALGDLGRVLDAFGHPHLEHLPIFVHVDLVAGLENNEAGIEYLADFNSISGVVTVHHHLTAAARRLGLLSIVRLFLSDSRAVDRGLSVVKKSHPDAVEILPAIVAAKVAADFADCHIPRIAGGLCRTEADVADVLASGCRAVTSTSPVLWKINPM